MPENDLDGGEDRSQAKAEGLGRGGTDGFFPVSRMLWITCLVQFVLLLALAFALWHAPKPDSDRPIAPSSPASVSSDVYFKGNPGPWGQLEYARIQLKPSDEFIPTDAHCFGPTRWFFEGYTRPALSHFFDQCGLTASQLAGLKDPAIWQDQPSGIEVMPPDDLVLGLAEPARERIYSVLARSRLNILHLWPFKSREGGVDEWFGQSGLSAGTLALLRQLTYSRGGRLCFSDLSIVYPRISTSEERRRLIKTLASTSALLVKLQVKPDSDVAALADYWSKGQRTKDIQALLESLKNIPGGMTIDVTHLLPPFARKRLYTFPVPPLNSAKVGWPDCNWTAMNFFNDPPDDRFYDSDVWMNELHQNYTEVKQATFGDLIVFFRPDGFPIHMVVFIADDIVFTKNGSSSWHPWTLMKWDDLMADYTLDYVPAYIVFHPKEQTE
ncbi:MAG: hypothetical protein WBN22_12230 [Verrucomicrobiia bacterium]